MGWPEIFVILIVAMVVFGPERLPDMARQAARMLKTVRQLADQAKSDLRSELGDDFADIHLSDLDPRRAVREAIADVGRDISAPPPLAQPSSPRGLGVDELPPFDDEAT